MARGNEGTIIIKKVVKGGAAAHGGAWKVAYADFVTAMMAFFLLLWLLNVTNRNLTINVDKMNKSVAWPIILRLRRRPNPPLAAAASWAARP